MPLADERGRRRAVLGEAVRRGGGGRAHRDREGQVHEAPEAARSAVAPASRPKVCLRAIEGHQVHVSQAARRHQGVQT